MVSIITANAVKERNIEDTRLLSVDGQSLIYSWPCMVELGLAQAILRMAAGPAVTGHLTPKV